MLVTGLDGFTGIHLGPLLQQRGYEVIRGAQPEFDLLRPDLMAAAVEAANPDFVIHLAGISFVAHDDAAALYAVNTVGTTSLLKALEPMAARLRKVVLASTSQVYGNATDDPITEQTPTAPVSHYACSKLAMESMARTWFNRLPILITRPFNYIGRRPGASNFLCQSLSITSGVERRWFSWETWMSSASFWMCDRSRTFTCDCSNRRCNLKC